MTSRPPVAGPPSAGQSARRAATANETGSRSRILVVGCGALGGVIAASLTEQGHDVTAFTTNADIARALREHGFRVRGELAIPDVKAERVCEELDASVGLFDTILLSTQPPQVEEAARSVAAYLAPHGRMVCFQNGLCEERIAPFVGRQRVVGAVVAWGASMLKPGVYDRTSAGGFTLGRLDGEPDEPVEQLGRILEAIGPVTLTGNLLGARFSKLAINCAISTLGTIGGDRIGPLLRHRYARRLALEVMTETVEVAQAERVRLEKVAGTIDLEWVRLTEAEKMAGGSPSLVAKHALLLAVGARYRRLRSSMLAAIERGRTPAVDFLNGEVITRADRHGIVASVNRAAQAVVWAIARGEVRPGTATLRELYDRTRS